MDGRKRIVLEDNARLGKIRDELIHVGLRLFAVRTLEIGEFDELEILGRRATEGAICALLQQSTIVSKRMLAEWNDLLAHDDVLLVGGGEECEAIGLLLSRF